jgi:hypothetical protein
VRAEAGRGASAPAKGGSSGKRRGKPKKKGGKPAPKDVCHNCGKIRHWAHKCKEPRHQNGAHLAQEEEEEPALLMAQVCAISEGVEEAPHAHVVLDETRAQVNLAWENDDVEERWYLDSGASNHMTENREAFSELDTGVVGTVKFGNNSVVDIRGHGTILFHCKSG